MIAQVKSNQFGLLRRLECIVATTVPIEIDDGAISREIARKIGLSKSMPWISARQRLETACRCCPVRHKTNLDPLCRT